MTRAVINGESPAPSLPEPRIIAFLCNWCSYAGADKAGVAQTVYPANVNIIRVPCSGSVHPQFILEAFHQGADGVMVLACHPGDCHYKEGNFRAAQRLALLGRLTDQLGIDRTRTRFDYVSAGEGEKFVRIVTEMVAELRELGPMASRRNDQQQAF
jgi:F420-non-reducing hydrogenase iron-sulfur subunit